MEPTTLTKLPISALRTINSYHGSFYCVLKTAAIGVASNRQKCPGSVSGCLGFPDVVIVVQPQPFLIIFTEQLVIIESPPF